MYKNIIINSNKYYNIKILVIVNLSIKYLDDQFYELIIKMS